MFNLSDGARVFMIGLLIVALIMLIAVMWIFYRPF